VTNGNEPAFAKAGWYANPDVFVDEQLGMTKREYFAAMAMQGFLSQVTENFGWNEGEETAEAAVTQADALIEALNKEAK
jgi:hypothetical protein